MNSSSTEEKIKLIAYRLWLERRENGTAGNAEHDYFHAERIFTFKGAQKPLILASLNLWIFSFLLGRDVHDGVLSELDHFLDQAGDTSA